MPSHKDDEALARALQEEYDLEFQTSLRPPGGHSSTITTIDYTLPPPTNPELSSVEPMMPPVIQRTEPLVDEDEEYARRLAAEEALGFRAPTNSSSWGPSKKRDEDGTHLTLSSSGDLTPTEAVDDVEYAKRLQQELHDEEIARRLNAAERHRQDQRQAQFIASAAAHDQNSNRCTPRKMWSYLIPLLVVVGALVAVFFVLGIDKDDINDFVPTLEDFREEDPFNGVSIEDAYMWRTGGNNGLTIQLLNALSDDWYTYFYEAVSDWENGEPDALSLSSAIRDRDIECEPVEGKIKVCNGDYGVQTWRGINYFAIERGYMVSSIAKMNDYFIGKNDVDLRQYTMCHEIGHGFGLPHTDTNFDNADLGNCMDYTRNYGDNKRPNSQTYEMLALIYGNITESRRDLFETEDRPLNPSLLRRWRERLDEVHSSEDLTAFGWRRLHANEYFEAHSLDIGDGISLHVHKLLA